MLSRIKKGIAIIASANNKIVVFCLNVIDLFITNSSKCFLYTFVPLNQTSNLLDPLTKQKDAKSKNGVVGNKGKIIPIIPINMKTNPNVIYITFIIFVMALRPLKIDQLNFL